MSPYLPGIFGTSPGGRASLRNGPRLAASQVRGRHRIPVIHEAGWDRGALVQVQRDQQDAQQFWLAVLGAVRHATGADGGAEPPAATPDFNAPAMAGRVLSELADAPGGVTLIIDDLHELTSPEALAQLTRLLTDFPPQVHAILTTRHDAPLGLHRLRLAGELAEIRAADLRFSERETRELLAASGVALSEAGVALLHQRTEGWAAGARGAR